MNTHKYRIMLVDDDPNLLRLLAIRLFAAGYEVTTADSGEAALGELPRCDPHLVITDLKMGGMDGLTLFRRIRAINESLPVIILTAHGSISDAVKATKSGVFGYLTKPFDSKVLLEQIAQAIASCQNANAQMQPPAYSRKLQ